MHIYKYAGALARSRYTGGRWWGLGLVVRLWTRCRASPILRCRLSDFSAMVDMLHSFAIHEYVCVWWVCMSVCVLASWGGECLHVCMYVCMYHVSLYARMYECMHVCMYTIHICAQACTVTQSCFVQPTATYTHKQISILFKHAGPRTSFSSRANPLLDLHRPPQSSASAVGEG